MRIHFSWLRLSFCNNDISPIQCLDYAESLNEHLELCMSQDSPILYNFRGCSRCKMRWFGISSGLSLGLAIITRPNPGIYYTFRNSKRKELHADKWTTRIKDRCKKMKTFYNFYFCITHTYCQCCQLFLWAILMLSVLRLHSCMVLLMSMRCPPIIILRNQNISFSIFLMCHLNPSFWPAEKSIKHFYEIFIFSPSM